MRFSTLEELKELCRAESLSIGQLMVKEQALETGKTEIEVIGQMSAYYEVMKEAVHRGLSEDTTSRSGLTGKDAQRVSSFMGQTVPSLGTEACTAMAYALAVSEVNASMGRIIATP